MYTSRIRHKAISLRNSGLTYSQIQTQLNTKIPKSTLSGWLKSSSVPENYYENLRKSNRIHLGKVRVKAALRLKEKRTLYLNEISNRNSDIFKCLDKRTLKLILAILYLGEGAKYKSSKFLALANSNPEIIKVFIKLLSVCFSTNPAKFRVRIQVRFDQDIREIEAYWKKTTNIPRNQFYPTYVDKRTSGSRTKKQDYKGVCTVYYFNTDFQLELEMLANSVVQYIVLGR